MTLILDESNLRFLFKSDVEAIKFDEAPFYTDRFRILQGSKGVDFWAYKENTLYFIEVKNFTGYEIENKKRLFVNTNESLAHEISYKVRDSLACLSGTYKNENSDLTLYFNRFKSPKVTVRIIFFWKEIFITSRLFFAQYPMK